VKTYNAKITENFSNNSNRSKKAKPAGSDGARNIRYEYGSG